MIGSIRERLLAAATSRAVAKSGWASTALLAALTHFTYVALAVVLILAGLGVPIPEDVPLVLSGFMCNRNYSPIALAQKIDTDGDGIPDALPPGQTHLHHMPDIPLMILAGMIGVLLGDTIVFYIGRHGIESNSLVARHLRKVMHSKRRERIERYFARHGNLTIFFGRFVMGMRSIVFALAGLSKMSYTRFILIDGVAAAISVPAFILLGYYFADKLTGVFIWIDHIKHILIPVLVGLAVAAILIYYLRKRRRLAAAKAADIPAP